MKKMFPIYLDLYILFSHLPQIRFVFLATTWFVNKFTLSPLNYLGAFAKHQLAFVCFINVFVSPYATILIKVVIW